MSLERLQLTCHWSKNNAHLCAERSSKLGEEAMQDVSEFNWILISLLQITIKTTESNAEYYLQLLSLSFLPGFNGQIIETAATLVERTVVYLSKFQSTTVLQQPLQIKLFIIHRELLATIHISVYTLFCLLLIITYSAKK